MNKTLEADGKGLGEATRRVVLCGSMTFYGEMFRVQEFLAAQGVRCLLPDAEDHLVGSMSGDQYEMFKREVSFAHLRRIRSPMTFGILVINFDKHGIMDYIGPSTFAEIAVATVSGKRVYLLNDYPSVYADELSAWQVVALRGRLDELINAYQVSCIRQTRQLSMFPGGKA